MVGRPGRGSDGGGPTSSRRGQTYVVGHSRRVKSEVGDCITIKHVRRLYMLLLGLREHSQSVVTPYWRRSRESHSQRRAHHPSSADPVPQPSSAHEPRRTS